MVWAFWAAVSPDGRNVYVSGGVGNSIAVLRRDAATRRLRQPAGAAGCVRNRRGGASQGGPGPGEDGCLQVDGLRYPRTVAPSPDGRFLYAAAFDADAILTYARDPATGALTPAGEAAPAHDGVTDLALSRDGRFVYATAYHDGAVSAFARDTTTGSLALIGCVAEAGRAGCAAGHGLRGAFNLALSPDGRSLYVAARHSGSLAVLDVDTATGALRQKPAGDGCRSAAPEPGCRITPGLRGTRGVTVSPDGRNVYTGAFTDSAVRTFARAADGRLAPLPGRTRVRQAWGVTVSPDGRFAYVGVGGDGNSGLAVFARDGGRRP
jgi:6-phosphogluconolactonase (cycloisomerase 2 family)